MPDVPAQPRIGVPVWSNRSPNEDQEFSATPYVADAQEGKSPTHIALPSDAQARGEMRQAVLDALEPYLADILMVDDARPADAVLALIYGPEAT